MYIVLYLEVHERIGAVSQPCMMNTNESMSGGGERVKIGLKYLCDE